MGMDPSVPLGVVSGDVTVIVNEYYQGAWGR